MFASTSKKDRKFLEEENENLKQQLKDEQAKKLEMLKQIDDLKQDKKSFAAGLDLANLKITDKDKEIEALTNSISQMQLALKEQRLKEVSRDEESIKKDKKIIELQEDNVILRKEIVEVKEENKGLKQEKLTLEEEMEKLQAQLKSSQEKVNDLEEQLKKSQESLNRIRQDRDDEWRAWANKAPGLYEAQNRVLKEKYGLSKSATLSKNTAFSSEFNQARHNSEGAVTTRNVINKEDSGAPTGWGKLILPIKESLSGKKIGEQKSSDQSRFRSPTL